MRLRVGQDAAQHAQFAFVRLCPQEQLAQAQHDGLGRSPLWNSMSSSVCGQMLEEGLPSVRPKRPDRYGAAPVRADCRESPRAVRRRGPARPGQIQGAIVRRGRYVHGAVAQRELVVFEPGALVAEHQRDLVARQRRAVHLRRHFARGDSCSATERWRAVAP